MPLMAAQCRQTRQPRVFALESLRRYDLDAAQEEHERDCSSPSPVSRQ